MTQIGRCHLFAGVLFAAFGAAPQVFAEGLNFTCNANINTLAGTDGYTTNGGDLCGTIQSTLASSYGSIFSNANANIYIEFTNDTGLGASTTGYLNLVSYSTWFNALAARSSGDAVDTAALAGLTSTEASVFSGTNGKIELSSAQAQALGIASTNGDLNYVTGVLAPTGIPSINSSLTACNVLTDGSTCYNGIIYLQDPGTIAGFQDYYYGTASTFAGNLYDIYSIVEHEADEILGMASCVDTTGITLTVDCRNNASAVDLFRYTAAGTLAAYPTTAAAYFSYDGGVTNVANYNHAANGEDYSDFSADCQHVQDAQGCLGHSLDIGTDGGAEVTILDSVGYNLTTTTTPEPGTITLLGSGILLLAGVGLRRRMRRNCPDGGSRTTNLLK